MLRSAALRALGAIGASADSKAVLALLKDPALVVRTEAIETILRLKPEGSVEALLETLEAPENYHGGKAQWVPQHALEALIQLKAPPTIAPRLAPLLRREHQGDQSLQQSVLAALEALTGKRLKHGASLSARVEAWSRELRGEAPSPSSAHR
jgi:HEAT repeat protein